MAPARFDAAAPPTRESVTDNEGQPTTGSDPFKFMVWLAFVEERIKTANPNFFELYTTGRITTHKHTVVASAEHATELSTTVNPTLHTFASPAPVKPRTTTAMPDSLKSEFNAQPDLLIKYDREGYNTVDNWLTNTAMRKEFSRTTGSTGRRLLIALQQKKEEFNSNGDINGILTKYAAWHFQTGIPAGTIDSFDEWIDSVLLWNNACHASTREPDTILSDKIIRATRRLGGKIGDRVDNYIDRLKFNPADPNVSRVPTLIQNIGACKQEITTQNMRDFDDLQDGRGEGGAALRAQGGRNDPNKDRRPAGGATAGAATQASAEQKAARDAANEKRNRERGEYPGKVGSPYHLPVGKRKCRGCGAEEPGHWANQCPARAAKETGRALMASTTPHSAPAPEPSAGDAALADHLFSDECEVALDDLLNQSGSALLCTITSSTGPAGSATAGGALPEPLDSGKSAPSAAATGGKPTGQPASRVLMAKPAKPSVAVPPTIEEFQPESDDESDDAVPDLAPAEDSPADLDGSADEENENDAPDYYVLAGSVNKPPEVLFTRPENFDAEILPVARRNGHAVYGPTAGVTDLVSAVRLAKSAKAALAAKRVPDLGTPDWVPAAMASAYPNVRTDAHVQSVPMGEPVAEAPAAAAPPSTPKTVPPTSEELTPESPVKSMRLYVSSSPLASVRAVSVYTGGSTKRTKAEIYSDIRLAESNAAKASAAKTSTSTTGSTIAAKARTAAAAKAKRLEDEIQTHRVPDHQMAGQTQGSPLRASLTALALSAAFGALIAVLATADYSSLAARMPALPELPSITIQFGTTARAPAAPIDNGTRDWLWMLPPLCTSLLLLVCTALEWVWWLAVLKSLTRVTLTLSSFLLRASLLQVETRGPAHEPGAVRRQNKRARTSLPPFEAEATLFNETARAARSRLWRCVRHGRPPWEGLLSLWAFYLLSLASAFPRAALTLCQICPWPFSQAYWHSHAEPRTWLAPLFWATRRLIFVLTSTVPLMTRNRISVDGELEPLTPLLLKRLLVLILVPWPILFRGATSTAHVVQTHVTVRRCVLLLGYLRTAVGLLFLAGILLSLALCIIELDRYLGPPLDADVSESIALNTWTRGDTLRLTRGHRSRVATTTAAPPGTAA